MTLHLVHDADPLPLDRKKDGTPKTTLGNVMTILSSDSDWQGVIAYDEFAEAPILTRKPPQRTQDIVGRASGAPWSPQDSSRTATWMEERYGFAPSSQLVTEAVMAVAQCNPTHPLRDYLDGLRWDRVARVDSFLTVYCGVEDSAYARGVARMLFVSAIARVRQPGAKVDTMVIFEGPQGIGKSRLLKVLGGDWFADTPIALGDKDAYQSLRQVWIYEIGELAAFKGRDATRIKSFISSPIDHYRPSYERAARSVSRQCIFVGTTNETKYLTDATGARRFWPVGLSRIDLPAVTRDRDQLWAEADALYKGGTPWWPDTALDTLGADVQAERYEDDPWEQPIAEWLASPTFSARLEGGGTYQDRLDPADGVTVGEILSYALGMPKDRQDKRAQMRVGDILHGLGWCRGAQRREGNSRVRRWFRSEK